MDAEWHYFGSALLTALAAACMTYSICTAGRRSQSSGGHEVDESGDKGPIEADKVLGSASSDAAIPNRVSAAPYDISRRQMPHGTDPEQVLPPCVGSFRRDGFREQHPDLRRMVQADYTSPCGDVYMQCGISPTAAQACRGLHTVQAETEAEYPESATGNRHSIGTEPSFFFTTAGGAACFAWTRGRYFFLAHARGGKPVLDAFMEVFPF